MSSLCFFVVTWWWTQAHVNAVGPDAQALCGLRDSETVAYWRVVSAVLGRLEMGSASAGAPPAGTVAGGSPGDDNDGPVDGSMTVDQHVGDVLTGRPGRRVCVCVLPGDARTFTLPFAQASAAARGLRSAVLVALQKVSQASVVARRYYSVQSRAALAGAGACDGDDDGTKPGKIMLQCLAVLPCNVVTNVTELLQRLKK